MRNNHEILKKTPLLNDDGSLKEPGFCRKMLYDYDRSAIKAGSLRIKEWDFYQILSERFMVQVVIFDISIGGAANINVVDLQSGERAEFLSIKPLTLGKLKLPSNTEEPHKILYKQKDFNLVIEVKNSKRIISAFKKGKLDCHLELEEFKDHESLVMAVPFEKKGQFYLNQKMNCMKASGYCCVDKSVAKFNSETDFAVLDWGRGVWPYSCNWYWGNGSQRLTDGRVFGFEIGWGFGDMKAASENMLFMQGKAHKIGNINMRRDKSDWLKPWYFTSDDGRFEAIMTPCFDNHTSSRVGGVIGNVCHQVFGHFNGKAILDDGEVVEIKDMLAFTEFSDNRW